MSRIPERNEHGVRRYGQWAGRPAGHPEDPERCAEEVSHSVGRSFLYHQCSRKRGHGPNGEHCKQHDPAVVAAREAAQLAKYKAENRVRMEGFRLRAAAVPMLAALRKIALGHNDAKNFAIETLYELKFPIREHVETGGKDGQVE